MTVEGLNGTIQQSMQREVDVTGCVQRRCDNGRNINGREELSAAAHPTEIRKGEDQDKSCQQYSNSGNNQQHRPNSDDSVIQDKQQPGVLLQQQ